MFDNNAGRSGKRGARIEKEQLERKKTRKKATIVVIIVALLVAVSVFANSNFVRRSFPAVNVAGVNFSATEFEFFHSIAVIDYLNMIESEWGEMAQMMLPDRGLSFADQTNPMTGETWADTFYNLAIEMMTEVTLINLAADEVNFVLPDEDRAMLEMQIDQMRMFAPFQGFPDFASFIRFSYSMSMNERMFIESMEFLARAQAFAAHTSDSFTFTQTELDAEYDTNRDDLDLFIFRTFTVTPETLVIGDFDSAEEFLEAQEVAQEEARERIEGIISRINSEDDFIFEAREYDEEMFYEADSTMGQAVGMALDHIFSEWLAAPERVHGDVTSIESNVPDGFGGETFVSTILFFIERNDNNYNMIDMREIFFSRESILEQVEFEITDEEEFFDSIDVILEERAVEVLRALVAAGSTEGAFIELVAEHSDGFVEGGLHTQVAKTNIGWGETVPAREIVDWLFEEGRQVGDFELIRSDELGYHIVFVSGFGDLYRDFVAEARLRSSAFEEWRGAFTTDDVSRRWAFFFVSV
jgi:hypothetical protein